MKSLFFLPSLLALAVFLGACQSAESTSAADRGANESAPPPPDPAEGLVGTQDGSVAVALSAEPGTVEAGSPVTVQLENRGEVAVQYGRPLTVERWNGDQWTETRASRETMWTMELLSLAPGETGVEQSWPFERGDRPAPGWYRFTKQVHAEAGSGPPTNLQPRARVHVTR